MLLRSHPPKPPSPEKQAEHTILALAAEGWKKAKGCEGTEIAARLNAYPDLRQKKTIANALYRLHDQAPAHPSRKQAQQHENVALAFIACLPHHKTLSNGRQRDDLMRYFASGTISVTVQLCTLELHSRRRALKEKTFGDLFCGKINVRPLYDTLFCPGKKQPDLQERAFRLLSDPIAHRLEKKDRKWAKDSSVNLLDLLKDVVLYAGDPEIKYQALFLSYHFIEQQFVKNKNAHAGRLEDLAEAAARSHPKEAAFMRDQMRILRMEAAYEDKRKDFAEARDALLEAENKFEKSQENVLSAYEKYKMPLPDSLKP